MTEHSNEPKTSFEPKWWQSRCTIGINYSAYLYTQSRNFLISDCMQRRLKVPFSLSISDAFACAWFGSSLVLKDFTWILINVWRFLKQHLHWFFPLKMQWRISLRAGYISSWWLDIFIMSNTIAEKVYLGKKVQKNWTSHFFQKAGNISLLIFRFWFFHNISNFIIC